MDIRRKFHFLSSRATLARIFVSNNYLLVAVTIYVKLYSPVGKLTNNTTAKIAKKQTYDLIVAVTNAILKLTQNANSTRKRFTN